MSKTNYDETHSRRPGDDALREIRAAEAASARKKRLIVIAVILVLAIGAAALWIVSNAEKSRRYDSYKILSETATGPRSCVRFGKLILSYSANGITATDRSGELQWDQGYAMSDPVLVTSAGYAMVYDRGAGAVSLFDADGPVSTYTLPSAITSAGVSDYGMGAFMTHSGTSSSVFFYDKTGRRMDIEVKNVLAESSGYPIAMSLSPSGESLALSLTFMDRGSIETRVTFLNFDEGKDRSDRVVGFYEYDDVLFPALRHISESSVVAFGDDRAVFYSLSDPTSPAVSNEVLYEERISSVAAGDGKAAVVLRSASGGYTLKVYGAGGDETLSYDFDFAYTRFDISGDYVMVYGGEVALITTAGSVKYQGGFDGIISSMVATGKNTFLQYGDFGARVVELD